MLRNTKVNEQPVLQTNINPANYRRVLHLPYNAAGQMSTQALGLKKLGVDVSFCDYYGSQFQFESDLASPIAGVPKDQRDQKMIEFAKKCVNQYDTFHFHFGQTFTRYTYEDLDMLKKLNKKMVMNYWGSQVRRLSIAKRKNPYAIVKQQDEKLIISRMEKVSKYIDTAIVLDHELLEHVEGYFKKVYVIRTSVNPDTYNPVYPSVKTKRPLIVHAPTHREVKGTEYVVKAIQRIKEQCDIDFKLIENMTNAEARKWYQKADIIVDQLRLGAYGKVSIEGMLFGKPVINYIREDLISKYPSNLPIVSANPNTIEYQLLNLIQKPKLRHKLGIKGRKYAIKHHNQETIARQLLTVYNDL